MGLLLIWLSIVSCAFASSPPPLDASWTFVGPLSYTGGDGAPLEKILDAGAIQALHLLDGGPATLAGSTNGGVWKTDNIEETEPHWRCVTDNSPVTCSSISALGGSPFDGTLYAGCGGSTSGEMGVDWNVLEQGDWRGNVIKRQGRVVDND